MSHSHRMTPIKARLARRAAKATVRHSARGATSKLSRSPVRSGALFGLGCAVGLVAGWLIGRPAAASP